MAKKVQVILVDDLDGGVANETVTFGLDGVTYEIDLSTANAQELRSALTKWVENAHKVSTRGGARGGRRSRTGSGGSSRATEIREWARAQGFKVNDRGRIPAEIQEKYDAAH